MDINIMDAITNVGFPIVCVLAMAWYVKYKTDKYDTMIAEITTHHHEEVKELTDANNEQNNHIIETINNNTVALQQLTDYIKLTRGE